MHDIIESLLMIGVISAALITYALWEARRENRETLSSKVRPFRTVSDPDAHLGRTGTE